MCVRVCVCVCVCVFVYVHINVIGSFSYCIVGIFHGGKFSHTQLQFYYRNYLQAEFLPNVASSTKY